MALVRVKRRLVDDPADALLVTSKKLKTDYDVQATVFKFAATVKEDEDVSAIIKKIDHNEKYKLKLNNVEKITEKLRLENKNNSANNRLKIVNMYRCVGSEEDEGGGSRVTVVDLESAPESSQSSQTPPCSESQDPLKIDDEYVYDVYFTNSLDVCDASIDNILSAIPLGNEILFDEYRDDSNEEYMDDEDDSNDENCWKNDYPDEEESYSSIDEEVMRVAASRMGTILIDSDGEYKIVESSDECLSDSWIYGADGCEDQGYVRHAYDSSEASDLSQRSGSASDVSCGSDISDNDCLF